jgi:hypothetical protein
MQAMLELLKGIGHGEYCSRQAFMHLSRYIAEACKHKATQSFIAPYLQEILIRVMLPLCFFTDKLHKEWTDDPMEVIRKNSMVEMSGDMEDVYDVRNAAVNVMLEVMKIKPLREQLLEPFMREVVSIAQAYRAQHGTPLGAAGTGASLSSPSWRPPSPSSWWVSLEPCSHRHTC